MTPFTDDDLKQLKRRLKYHNQVHPGWFDGPEEIKVFNALLSRLDAAEHALNCLESACDDNALHPIAPALWDTAVRRLETWRKAAGRE